jgi:tetratricopeptide (TPR) repeat protein
VFFSLTKVIESGNIIGIGAFGYVYLFADVLPDFDDDDDDDDDWRTRSTGFAKASEKAKMAEAPRIMATFESAYLAALVENGDNADITENDLYFKPVTDSKWFKYEYVTSAQGGIVGYKATASKNIGKFNKGNFLQTVYQKDSDDFTHCVGGKRADMRVVEELIPEFDATVECNNVEIKKVSGSAPAVAQQNNTEAAQSDANVSIEECSFLELDKIKASPLIIFYGDEEDFTSGYGESGNQILLFIDSHTKDSILVVLVFSETYREMYKFIFNKTLKDAEEIFCRYEGLLRVEEISYVKKKTLKTSKNAEKDFKKTFSETKAAMYKELRKYSTNGNNDTQTYIRNGMKYLESGDNKRRPADYDTAVYEFTKAILLSQNNAEAYYGRGRTYLRQGYNYGAVLDYTEAIRLNPKDAISYSNRGRAYARMGDYDNAVADFESALRIDPNNEAIKQNLEKARRREKGL